MRILLVDDDIFTTKGGGQTVYRKLINDHPDAEFYYFRRNESEDAKRPRNCIALGLPAKSPVVMKKAVFLSGVQLAALQLAVTYADAVRGLTFDVVDAPDYKLFGPYLREALVACRVQFGALVHALHGVLSDSLRFDWTGNAEPLLDLRALEQQQFEAADLRYGISRAYAQEWTFRSAAPVRLVDPSGVLEPRNPVYEPENSDLPQLLCVGRRERRKGNDIALDIAAWLPPDVPFELRHIGPPSAAGLGQSSDDILKRMASVRDLDWLADEGLAPDALFHIYRNQVIVLAPVRYDTFNLVALEAMALGVPLVISERAGVCDYLDSLEQSPLFLKIDPSRPADAAQRLSNWLRDYGAIREQTHAFALAFQKRIQPLNLRAFYQEAIASGMSGRLVPTFPGLSIVKRETVPGISSLKAPVRRAALLVARQPAARRFYRGTRALLAEVRGVPAPPLPEDVASLARTMNAMPERREREIEAKIATAGLLSGRAGGRAVLWGELARLERLRSEDLRAAAYDLRIWRLGGMVDSAGLKAVCATLDRSGLSSVSTLLPAQYGPNASMKDLGQILDERQVRLRQSPGAFDLLQKDDRRDPAHRARISILVSLYGTNGKLTRFLDLIAHQTVRNAVEIIFVDAASPYDEWGDVAEGAGRLNLDFCYLRTKRRITIQAAWNLALGYARGDYIACLGVDEALFPEALQRLSELLDRRPDIDWAMGSSLVTAVDTAGSHLADKMIYDRKDAHRDMAFLDTTYVSWVGGLYRRSVHDRFGYYDPEFHAAGDTEFKMRVLPHLQVAFVPQTLGLFLDYPDRRATAGVLAELEDALAWYSYRTEEGAAQLFSNASSQALTDLLFLCAGRRKCFRADPSTDVELGVLLANILTSRSDAPPYIHMLANLFSQLRADLRDYAFAITATASPTAIEARWKAFGAQFNAMTEANCDFRVFNDNVFEQHCWIWPARP